MTSSRGGVINRLHGPLGPTSCAAASGCDKFIPLADHVAVLVHDRVPHTDVTHAVPERAAVAYGAGAFDLFAGRAQDVALGRLAFHPVIPFVGSHVILCGLEHGRVIALTIEKGANPAGQVPVDEFVSGVEH